jgi:hypothetical protein
MARPFLSFKENSAICLALPVLRTSNVGLTTARSLSRCHLTLSARPWANPKLSPAAAATEARSAAALSQRSLFVCDRALIVVLSTSL